MALILVVDDERAIRNLVCDILIPQGYEVLEAADGLAALELCAQIGGPVDLLLTDIVMPRMDGLSLAERLSAQWPALRVIYMSAQCEATAVQHHVVERGYLFLRKPFQVDLLLATVRRALTGPGRKPSELAGGSARAPQSHSA